MPQFTLGSAAITVFNAGDLRTYLADWLGVRAEDWPQYHAALAQPIASPMQTVHIALGNASVIVDAGQWNFTPDSEYWLPGYTPPPDIASQLSAAHLQPKAVTHVVVTHAHFDHFNALVIGNGTESAITFPNAQHYLGKADWEAKAQVPGSEAHYVFGTLHERGRLTLVEGDLEIADGIMIMAARPLTGANVGLHRRSVSPRGRAGAAGLACGMGRCRSQPTQPPATPAHGVGRKRSTYRLAHPRGHFARSPTRAGAQGRGHVGYRCG